jgi:hypothetical protein
MGQMRLFSRQKAMRLCDVSDMDFALLAGKKKPWNQTVAGFSGSGKSARH